MKVAGGGGGGAEGRGGPGGGEIGRREGGFVGVGGACFSFFFFFFLGGVVPHKLWGPPTAEVLLIAPTGVWNGWAGAEADSVRPERRILRLLPLDRAFARFSHRDGKSFRSGLAGTDVRSFPVPLSCEREAGTAE